MNESQELQQLFNRLKNLIYAEAIKFIQQYPVMAMYDTDGLVSEAFIVIAKSYKKYNSDTKETTFFVKHAIKNHWKNLLKKELKLNSRNVYMYDNEFIDFSNSRFSFLDNISSKAKNVLNIINQMPEELVEIFEKHRKWNDGYVIAKFLGINRNEMEDIKKELADKMIY